MIIYDKNNVQKADIVIDNQTKLTRSINGDDRISCVFNLETHLELLLGDYIVWRGDKYTIINESSVRKNKTNDYRYNVDFYAPKFIFNQALMVLDNKTEYPLFGKVEDHVAHILSNVNRVLSTSYIVGVFPYTKALNIQYENINCLDALNEIIDTFFLEWELVGLSVNIYSVIEKPLVPDLRFQFKNGLRGIDRKKMNKNELVTRLYALGSDRNITFEYGYKRLRINPVERNIAEFGIFEKTVVFDEVFPHYVGEVFSVGTELQFSDLYLPFDLNAAGILIAGSEAKISFSTGDLTGYEFLVQNYNSITKTFTLIVYDDGNGLSLPNATFKPQVGDKYIIYGINMPPEYISEAENELLSKADEYMDFSSYPTVIYEITPDISFIALNTIQFELGHVITVFDSDLRIDITSRITDFTQSLAEPYNYVLKIGNKLKEGFVKEVNKETSGINSNLSSSVDALNKSVNFIKNKTVNSTTTELVTVNNQMLLPETKGQNSITSGLKIIANYGGDPNDVYLTDCEFTHFTIENAIRTWQIENRYIILNDALTRYYIYLKCSKTTSTGEFIFSPTSLFTDDGQGNYNFLIASLSPEVSGVRVLNVVFSTGEQTTNIYQSQDFSADQIKQMYESNPDTNAFTDALKTKLEGISVSGATNTIMFGEVRLWKASGNITQGVLEKNDVIVIRWTNQQFVWLLYDGVGATNQISSYKILNELEITLWP